MRGGFRNKMSTLHTWAGLVLSALLFAIFWTGTLSVFDHEIDRWMIPTTRIQLNNTLPEFSVDEHIVPILIDRAESASDWTILLPRERLPFYTLVYKSRDRDLIPYTRENFHPLTLETLPDNNTRGASRFIYPFHHNLTIRKDNIGAWIVGVASMGMLVLMISGIIIHRRIFIDFFTLRLFRSFGRANLDVHNLSGVILFPFTIVITLSGLIIVHQIYFPKVFEVIYKNDENASSPLYQTLTRNLTSIDSKSYRSYSVEALGRSRTPATGLSAPISSIDMMIDYAESQWGDGSVSMIRITHPGDANGIASLRIPNNTTVTKQIGNMNFNLSTGDLVEIFTPSQAINFWSFIGGLHYIQFSHWTIRWLYFIAGLGCCAMIATGLFHWTQARNKNKKSSGFNVALMNSITISSVTGIIAATASFLLINRIFNNRDLIIDIEARDLEVYFFYFVWIFCFFHATTRTFTNKSHGYLKAWKEQCYLIVLISFLALILNWFTTGDHLVKTLITSSYFPVAGVDSFLLVSIAIGMWVSIKIKSRISITN